ncbi:MAG TPA: cell division protein FtsN, partial [Planctomycetota bacterium]|nr:cell division protein FtsN [Planctomycetota bacterium]
EGKPKAEGGAEKPKGEKHAAKPAEGGAEKPKGEAKPKVEGGEGKPVGEAKPAKTEKHKDEGKAPETKA